MRNESSALASGEFQKLLQKAGKIFECAWAISVVKDESSGRFRPVLVFHDASGGSFAFAFSFPSVGDVSELCGRIAAASEVAFERNRRSLRP